MDNQPEDINRQIDRILSCNIRDELLSGLPFELLQSPVIQKRQPEYSPQSSSSIRSKKRTQIEEDFYEKAELIFKLKEVLENELANINEIVMDNQKLTEANECLKLELKKVKGEMKEFRKSVLDGLICQKESMEQLLITQVKGLQESMQNKAVAKRNKMSIFMCNEMIDKSLQIKLDHSVNHHTLQIQSKSIFISIKPHKQAYQINLIQTFTQTQTNLFSNLPSIQSLQKEINTLSQTIQFLQTENTLHIKKLQILQLQTLKLTQNSKQSMPLRQKQLNHQQQPIQCYSSIFMKSIFQQDTNIDEIIRKALFNSEKSIFDQLQETKYFGQIISTTKNGNAIEHYKNNFQYEGKFFKNLRHGLGQLFYQSQLIYAGHWKYGKFQGKGILYYYLNLNVQKIQSNFKNGMIDGYGTLSLKSGYKIRAQFRNNLILSEGILLLGQNCQSNLKRKSYLGKIQLIKDKQNLQHKDKILFETQEGQLIDI